MLVRFGVDDGVARIVLDRPERGNALDLIMAGQLHAAARRAHEAATARAVLIEGAGARFCVGGDLVAFAAAGDGRGDYLGRVADELHEAIELLHTMPGPVVAAVQGSAAGAGLGLAAACDIVMAAQSAQFVFAYPTVGLTPDCGASWWLPRQVGLRRALAFALLDRPLGAAEAVEWGLASRVVPDADLAAEAAQVVGTLAAGPTAAHARTRALLRASLHHDLPGQLRIERDELVASASTGDAREGIEAFLGRRAPRFAGR